MPDERMDIPCHPKNHGGRRQAGDIRYLVYHYTGNDGDKAAANGAYYRDRVVEASAHYFVDDTTVVRSVDDLTVAWAVGGGKWSDCPRTGGGKLYGVVTNTNSLSIELCGTLGDGSRGASPATLARAAELGRELMEKYHIPAENVVRHFDVTGKHCPAYFMDGEKWRAFKARLKGREETVKLYTNLAEMPAWAKGAAEKALAMGYIQADEKGDIGVWETNLQCLEWMNRAGMLDSPARVRKESRR